MKDYRKQINTELEELDKRLEKFERKCSFITLVIIIFFFGIFVGVMIMRWKYNIWY